ncbi:hypothetical protein BBF96_14070 [Anoxybacter fermentans]|uniref:Inhibitor of sigma-G Gin n=1 Tax=Anoxybacter fermentans TaxID=1323375 RepID=A0A3Q9HSA2_9FIRM|nr:sigma factor G inhibitor Gin [Anoxybacter fermentans]AZR74414.1 hypothetical protein BBF96_14070 [Anoxybacter fermentans]
MTQDENRCIFCGELHIDGIRLCGKLICASCEKDLVNTEVDEPAYQCYKNGIKVIWNGEKYRQFLNDNFH